MSRRKDRKAVSSLQSQQRKLAWLLRITEGYIANAHSFSRWNFGDLPQSSTRALNIALDRCVLAAERFRQDMQTLEG